MRAVYLQDIVDELEMLSDRSRAFVNRQTGEVYTISEDDMAWLETDDIPSGPEWQRQAIAKAREVDRSEDWLILPSKFEIHEYAIMEAFCWQVSDDESRNELLYAIRGSGAFRHFKAAIRRLDMQDDWHQFRNDALEKIAREWLEHHQIPYQPGRRPYPS